MLPKRLRLHMAVQRLVRLVSPMEAALFDLAAWFGNGWPARCITLPIIDPWRLRRLMSWGSVVSEFRWAGLGSRNPVVQGGARIGTVMVSS